MATLTFSEPVARFNNPISLKSNPIVDSESPAGFMLGLVILVALLGLFFYYLLPYVQNAFTTPL